MTGSSPGEPCRIPADTLLKEGDKYENNDM